MVFDMRIGELSKKTGLSRDTIRFYERSGLIQALPEREAANNYRTYGDDALIRLELVQDAQAAGMTIADLTILVGQLSDMNSDAFDGFAFLDQKITQVKTRIAASEKFLVTLQETRDALARAPHE